MPSKAQILNILASDSTEATPLHRNKLADKLGENSYRTFQTQLDRFEKQGLIDGNPDHEYWITDVGMKELSDQSMVAEETDEEKLGTTEYQRFIHLGKITGVSPPELIKQTADHVWNGGDFTDLDWVARAFQEMGVRQDLRNRWWHSWRTYLHQPMPSSMPTAISEGEAKTEGKVSTKREGKGRRNYILDADDKPVYVGDGLGDMDYEDALDLARIRAGRSSRTTAGAPQTPGSMADEMVKMFGAFQQFMGDKAQGKSYMVRQGESGMEVEEVEPGRPMVVSSPQGNNKPNPTYFVGPDGEVQEVQPGQPIIIKQPSPPASNGGVQYLIDKATGQVQQVQPGQPIIIQSQPQQQSPYTPIQMKDKDGNPMVLDLSTFIRLEEHREKQRRDEESHEVKMEIAKGFKDMLGKASTALGHVSEEA